MGVSFVLSNSLSAFFSLLCSRSKPCGCVIKPGDPMYCSMLSFSLSFFKFLLFTRREKQVTYTGEGVGQIGSPLSRELDMGAQSQAPGSMT